MNDLIDIEELLFEVADLRQAHADSPAIVKCLDNAEAQLIAATTAAAAERRGLIDGALRLIQASRPDQAEAAPVTPVESELDPELLDSFLNESVEYLAEAEGAVLRLEADPRQREAIDQIFRAFHTVKGTAAFLELDVITELAHRSENLLSRARSGEVLLAGTIASTVLAAIDALKALVADLRATRRRPMRPPTHESLLAALDRATTDDPSDAAAAERATGAPLTTSVATAAAASPSPDSETADSVRVRVDRLDRLIDAVGELVIAQSMVAADPGVSGEQSRELSKKVSHAGKIVRELQDLAMSLRMVPLRATFQKLARVVRDASRKLGKHVVLVTEGAETEVDRSMVDVISDPLVHMVRNACDHGLEPGEVRAAAGKVPAGTLTLRAHHSAGSVVIELADDGRGLDRAKIFARAVAQGLVDADAQLSDADVYRLIFLPGFSTSEKVTDMSGRGVGMDVVRRAVESLSGRIEIDSTLGRGTTFRIRLPLTLAITDGMLVRVGDQRYIIPTVSIAMSMRPTQEQLYSVAGTGRMVAFRGRTIPVFRLADLSRTESTAGSDSLVVVLNDGEGHSAVLVDEILGKQQVVTKTLGDGIPAIRWIAGGAILGDGRVGLIVDPSNLLARFRSTGADASFMR